MTAAVHYHWCDHGVTINPMEGLFVRIQHGDNPEHSLVVPFPVPSPTVQSWVDRVHEQDAL